MPSTPRAPSPNLAACRSCTSTTFAKRSFGTWEGLLDEEILARFPEAHNGPWGDDETPEELDERVVEALTDIAASHPEGQVLVVSHGGPLRAVFRRCGAPPNGSQTATCARLAVEDGTCAD